MRRLEVGSLARHAPIMDAVRHAERDARHRGRSSQDGLEMTAIQAHYAQYLVWATRGLAMSTLAAHTRTSAANISQVVARMERSGLVRRERSPLDGRSTVVRITARGAHQFWQLLARLRRIERGYRADAQGAPARDLAPVLRSLVPAAPPLAPDPPARRRRHRPPNPGGP